MMSPPQAATRSSRAGHDMDRRVYDGFKQQAAVARLYPIVFICQRAADKISGGRSPNDQAFESLRRATGEPRARGVSARGQIGFKRHEWRDSSGLRGPGDSFDARGFWQGQHNGHPSPRGAAIKRR